VFEKIEGPGELAQVRRQARGVIIKGLLAGTALGLVVLALPR